MATEQQQMLDMNAEVANRQQPGDEAIRAPLNAQSSQELAARISEIAKQQGIDPALNPLTAEKIARDLEWQRQVEQLPQPDNLVPQNPQPTDPSFDELERLRAELDETKRREAEWKRNYGRSEGTVGGLKSRLKELEDRVYSMTPVVDVKQVTGREPGDLLTAQEIVNLMMSQSQALGNQLRTFRDDITNTLNSPTDSRIPPDMQGELLEKHPWLQNLPPQQKQRAMADMLASSGVSVAAQPPAEAPRPIPSPTPNEIARAQVRQAAFIEPSNKGSEAERRAMAPERIAFNEKVSKLRDLLNKPGGAKDAADILAALGAGPPEDSDYIPYGGGR